jgi:fibrillarin-like rRNA methylase
MSLFHEVDFLHDGRIVCVRRSERCFENVHELSRERGLLVKMLDDIGRSGRNLLIDSRAAPYSTDDQMQEEFQRFRLEVARGFERVATLVRTKVAILQVQRLCVSQTRAVQPFDDETAAIRYLLGELPAPSSKRLAR